ncbi:MAG: hypothetical protein ACYCV7_17045, partial [Acidimicrobiales bacterium]
QRFGRSGSRSHGGIGGRSTGRSAGSDPVPLTMGPPLPPERNTSSAPTIAGITPAGDALAIAVSGNDRLTLIAFLSSGCTTCSGFWQAFQTPEQLGLPGDIRLVVVTKGPEFEIAGEVQARAHSRLLVVMSTEAWGDYEVPGSPFFVLVDGKAGRRIGEGVANHFSQVAELVRRARVDSQAFGLDGQTPGRDRSRGKSRSRAFAGALSGPARESANDKELMAAGILPGDPSLYPTSLDEVFAPIPTGSASPAYSAPTAYSDGTGDRLSEEQQAPGRRLGPERRAG